MTQNDLGKAIGASSDIVGKYEYDEIRSSIDTVSKIVDALGGLNTSLKMFNFRTVSSIVQTGYLACCSHLEVRRSLVC